MRNGNSWVGQVTRFAAMVAALFSLATLAAEESPASSSAEVTSSSAPTVILNAGPGLVSFNGDYSRLYHGGSVGFGAAASVMGALPKLPIYVGVDFGLFFWGFDGTRSPGGALVERGAISIQLLPTIVCRFNNAMGGGFFPYLGLSMGPNLYVFRERTTDTGRGTVTSHTNTSLYFEMLARPGLEYDFARGVGVAFEPKFGVLNWDFLFAPQVNLTVTL